MVAYRYHLPGYVVVRQTNKLTGARVDTAMMLKYLDYNDGRLFFDLLVENFKKITHLKGEAHAVSN